MLALPEDIASDPLIDVLTDLAPLDEAGGRIRLGALLTRFPVALVVNARD